MFQSIIISGGNKETRRKKAIEILPFKLDENKIEKFYKEGISDIFDLYIINSDNLIGIEEIRNIEKNILLKPQTLPYKIFIIDNAEKLTVESQNALLKTLEEPPTHVMLILLTQNQDLLLSTIISRCQNINLGSSKNTLSEKEKINIYENVIYIFYSSIGNRILKTDEIIKGKTQKDISIVLMQTIIVLRELLLSKTIGKEYKYIDKAKVTQITTKQIIQSINKTVETKNLIERNINQKLALDHLFLSWAYI